MRASRSTEKPSLCLAMVGGVFAALLAGCVSPQKPAHHRSLFCHRFLTSDGTQTLVLRLNSMLFFKEFI